MALTIDWSLAPDDATHYSPETCDWLPCWVKQEGTAWYVRPTRNIHGPWFEFSDFADSVRFLVPRPTPTWTGEGLPPVGTRVVIHDDGSLIYGHGESGEVIAHVEDTAVVRMSYGLGCFTAECLRTPEQIAAEEREKAVDALRWDIANYYGASKVSGHYLGLARVLHDAGYRKITD